MAYLNPVAPHHSRAAGLVVLPVDFPDPILFLLFPSWRAYFVVLVVTRVVAIVLLLLLFLCIVPRKSLRCRTGASGQPAILTQEPN